MRGQGSVGSGMTRRKTVIDMPVLRGDREWEKVQRRRRLEYRAAVLIAQLGLVCFGITLGWLIGRAF